MLTAFLILAFSAATTESDTTIDLTESWRFQPDPEETGLARNWHTADFDDSGWPLIQAGTRWEEQGFPDVDGTAWMRRNTTIPADWKDGPVWLVLGSLSDCGTLYCNGQRIAVWGDRETISVHHTPLIADLSPALQPDSENVLVIEVFDWGGSGGIWNLPCQLTRDREKLPLDRLFDCGVDPATENIVVNTDMRVTGSLHPPLQLHAALYTDENTPPFRSASIPVEKVFPCLTLEAPESFPEQGVRMVIRLQNERGNAWQGLQTDKVIRAPVPPAWPAPYADLRMRNSFVTDLAEIPLATEKEQEAVFQNPRDGWVLFGVQQQDRLEKAPQVSTGVADECVAWRRNPDTGMPEAMLWMTEGEHRIRVNHHGGGAVLDVRAVPELGFCYYPFTWNMAAYGASDWRFMERHVLPHVNTIVTRSDVPEDEFHQWLREGRRWLANSGLPGLKAETAPAAEAVLSIWAQNRGVTRPGFSGIIVDEFILAGEAWYAAWGDAVAQLSALPPLEKRTFYAWCGELYQQQHGLKFARQLMEQGHRFVWEAYRAEQPTLESTEVYLRRELLQPFREWKAALPGVERHMVLCPGYLSAPPESLNIYPHIDYHVFLDMQFHLLANAPEFAGVYGVMEYMSNYADEESLRFAHRLFRHYCIEGRRERYTTAPLVLTHLDNPDFAEKLGGWQVESAVPGSISTDTMPGLSWLQGRSPKTTAGDTFCRMIRSAENPNRIRQITKDLKPGTLYSLKLISADTQDLHRKQNHTLRIEITGAEILDQYGFQYPCQSCYDHESGPYTRENPAWFNYHRMVFRPEGRTAKLCISDWTSDTEPGAPVEQETALNFVEVQPFHAP